MASQLEFLKEELEWRKSQPKSEKNDWIISQIEQQIMLKERQQHIDKMREEEPERYYFMMQNPCE